MRSSAIIIIVHQMIFQGMFFVKNITLRRRLGMPIRGRNPEAIASILFFAMFIIISIVFGLAEVPVGTISLMPKASAMTIALMLLVANLIIGIASLIGLKDSWRVGVMEDQQTNLIESGIYRFSRNPYFLSYLIMFAAYTLLLQNTILLVLSIIGFVLVHLMVLKEEKHLAISHGEKYQHYRKRVPRYLII